MLSEYYCKIIREARQNVGPPEWIEPVARMLESVAMRLRWFSLSLALLPVVALAVKPVQDTTKKTIVPNARRVAANRRRIEEHHRHRIEIVPPACERCGEPYSAQVNWCQACDSQVFTTNWPWMVEYEDDEDDHKKSKDCLACCKAAEKCDACCHDKGKGKECEECCGKAKPK